MAGPGRQQVGGANLTFGALAPTAIAPRMGDNEHMDIEKFTDRAKGFLQAAQTIAIREYHQRITPEHLLKALLDDEQGAAAGLIRAAGGDPVAAKQAVDADIGRQPKVTGGGAGQPQFTPD